MSTPASAWSFPPTAEDKELHVALHRVYGERIPSNYQAFRISEAARRIERRAARLDLMKSNVKEKHQLKRNADAVALGALKSYGPVFLVEPDLYCQIDKNSAGIRIACKELLYRIDSAIQRPDFSSLSVFNRSGQMPMRDRLNLLRKNAVNEAMDFFSDHPAGYLNAPVILIQDSADKIRRHERFHALAYRAAVDFGKGHDFPMAMAISRLSSHFGTFQYLAVHGFDPDDQQLAIGLTNLLSSNNGIMQAEEFFARVASAEKAGVEDFLQLDMAVAKGFDIWSQKLEDVHREALVQGVELVRSMWGSTDDMIESIRSSMGLPKIKFEDD